MFTYQPTYVYGPYMYDNRVITVVLCLCAKYQLRHGLCMCSLLSLYHQQWRTNTTIYIEAIAVDARALRPSYIVATDKHMAKQTGKER